ncbi:type II restriction enzyme [Bifidobacterium asteroides]|uniref:type II restriction enzyme n=1 Tax=Bifidobacterium asteroides TaxID=1684 RepID=UPI0018DBAFBC|nr:hypothetical protein [Bifidobacterium asteroides]MBH9983464.1 hypothetical protein [Bifidobacterium asteroides]
MTNSVNKEARDHTLASTAWEKIIHDYDIMDEISRKGYYCISAKTIKKYREPRLMAKWDSNENLPAALRERHLNILPVSRSEYLLSNVNLYEPLPEFVTSEPGNINHITQLDLESLDCGNITSESNAINAMVATGTLDSFLGDGDRTVETFNGRMGTDAFCFEINRYSGGSLTVHVDRAQMEIDGGFENQKNVIIIEAKNVLHPDFHIRQLYYPYRVWLQRVKKPIRLIFCQYYNMMYRLIEYRFADPQNYSSIERISSAYYTFQDVSVTESDIINLWKTITPVPDVLKPDIPFPQADKMDRIISLMEHMQDNEPMTTADITDYMGLDVRQSNYYASAGRYLDLFERQSHGSTECTLTPQARQILSLDYKNRQLALASRILSHQVFHEFFGRLFIDKISPARLRSEVATYLEQRNICNHTTSKRRASTVLGWLRWIGTLPEFTESQ